jgi:hypothetical protein
MRSQIVTVTNRRELNTGQADTDKVGNPGEALPRVCWRTDVHAHSSQFSCPKTSRLSSALPTLNGCAWRPTRAASHTLLLERIALCDDFAAIVDRCENPLCPCIPTATMALHSFDRANLEAFIGPTCDHTKRATQLGLINPLQVCRDATSCPDVASEVEMTSPGL